MKTVKKEIPESADELENVESAAVDEGLDKSAGQTETALEKEKTNLNKNRKTSKDVFLGLEADEEVVESFWRQRLNFGQFLVSQVLILLIGVGLIVLLAMYLSGDKAEKQLYTPVTVEPASLYLEVSNPEDESLVFDSSIVVSGRTLPEASVLVVSTTESSAFQPNPLGEFSKVFPLHPGMNTLVISAFDGQGNTTSVTRQIFYSKENFNEPES